MRTVLAASGPFSAAEAILPTQLSPAALLWLLCCELAWLPSPAGMIRDTLGRVPFAASVKYWLESTRRVSWLV